MKVVISVHCIGSIVAGYNADLFALTVVFYPRVLYCNSSSILLAVCVPCGNVYCPWGLGQDYH